jgi:hypothetical protein
MVPAPMNRQTYDYEVRINDTVIELGRILDHHRKVGRQVIREIADRHQTSTTGDVVCIEE